MSGEQPKYKPREQRCSNREQNVTWNSHPAQSLHGTGLHELGGTSVPSAVVDGCPGLQKSDRKHAQDNHENEAKVQRPEGEFQRSLLPPATRLQRTEENQRET